MIQDRFKGFLSAELCRPMAVPIISKEEDACPFARVGKIFLSPGMGPSSAKTLWNKAA